MAGASANGRSLDPGSRVILEEIRDLRVEMRADRRRADADRHKADADRRKADAERRKADEAWKQERRRADEAWKQERRLAEAKWQEERRRADEQLRLEREQSDAKFQHLLREFREDSARREAATQRAFRDIRTVGLSIVKTLNLHTRILERIDQKLGAQARWRPGSDNGRG